MKVVRNKTDSNSEQGCSLDELSRIQTLKVMGIQSWFSKYPPLQAEEEAQVLQQAVSVSEQQEPLSDQLNHTEKEISETATISNVSDLNWQQLQQAISHCKLCDLHIGRTQTVFGMGNPDADLMIISEAPGEEEDQAGEPFVGQVGQLLDAMLKAINLDRDKVFIANVIKCTTPKNRNPHVSEIVCCDAYLQRQIELVNPKLILVLGRVAAHHLLVTQDALGTLRNQFHSFNGIPLLVSYHPAYLIRKPIEKRKSWQDLLQIKKKLRNF